jgi:hypothetical protein
MWDGWRGKWDGWRGKWDCRVAGRAMAYLLGAAGRGLGARPRPIFTGCGPAHSVAAPPSTAEQAQRCSAKFVSERLKCTSQKGQEGMRKTGE